jgi:C-terminal processing protease CtpA/Prc
VGLKLKVVNKQLEVVEIREDSIFKGTDLKVGDKILSINDMSFRRYADAEYAFTLMDKASLLVTLVVERVISKDNDDTASTDDDVSSFSSFCNDDEDFHNGSSASKTTEAEGTDFNTPFTITVSKAFKRQDAGLAFKQTHRSSKKNTRVFVEKIARDSIFRTTALKKGDRVLMINNTDLRSNPDTNLAYEACMESNESIVMVVLRKESDPRSTSNKEINFSSGDWNIEL